MQQRAAHGAAAQLGEFRRSILPHMDAAYNLARFLARDAVAAEDIVQEAYLRAWRAFDRYRGGDAKAWLLTIVRNCAFSWSKARSAGGATQPLEGEEPGIADTETPETSALRASEIERVRGCVGKLPEPFCETLVLREFEDLSYRQIAAITGVALGTVMSRLARARALMGACLEGSR